MNFALYLEYKIAQPMYYAALISIVFEDIGAIEVCNYYYYYYYYYLIETSGRDTDVGTMFYCV